MKSARDFTRVAPAVSRGRYFPFPSMLQNCFFTESQNCTWYVIISITPNLYNHVEVSAVTPRSYTWLRKTSSGESAKRSRNGFHVKGPAPEGLPQIPLGIWLCSPVWQCPWAAHGSRPPSSCSSWSLEEKVGHSMTYARQRMGDFSTYTLKLVRPVKIAMKWLVLNPYSSTKKDADQRQEQYLSLLCQNCNSRAGNILE